MRVSTDMLRRGAFAGLQRGPLTTQNQNRPAGEQRACYHQKTEGVVKLRMVPIPHRCISEISHRRVLHSQEGENRSSKRGGLGWVLSHGDALR